MIDKNHVNVGIMHEIQAIHLRELNLANKAQIAELKDKQTPVAVQEENAMRI